MVDWARHPEKTIGVQARSTAIFLLIDGGAT